MKQCLVNDIYSSWRGIARSVEALSVPIRRDWSSEMATSTTRILFQPFLAHLTIISLLSSILLTAAAAAELPTESVEITAEEQNLNITPVVETIDDHGGRLTIRDVTGDSQRWTRHGEAWVNRGFTDSAVWFRISLINKTAMSILRMIEINKPNLDYIDFYVPRGDGTFDVRKTGDMRHFSTRVMPDRNFIFPVEAPPGLSTFYFRVRTDGALRFQLFSTSPRLHLGRTAGSLATLWIFFGMLLLMIIYNVAILVVTGNRSYLLFVLFVSSVFFYLLVLRGLAFQHLWPGAMKWNSMSIPFFLGLMCVTSALFARDQLGTRESSPLLDRMMIAAGILAGSAGILFSFLAKVSVANMVVYPLLAVLVIIIFIAMIRGVLKRNRPAVFLLVGFLFLILLMPVSIALTVGLLPMTTGTEFSLDFSVLWLVVFSSLGIADRLNTMGKELRESRERLQFAIDGSTDGIWDYTPGSDRIFLSPRCFTMLGYDPGDFPHNITTIRSLVHPEDRGKYLSTFNIRDGSAENHLSTEFRLRAKDGSWRWIVARGKAIHGDSAVKTVRIIGTNTDVTDAREALEALKKSEEKFYKLFKNSPSIVSVNTVPDLVYQDVNDRFFEVLGYSREEVIGHSILDLKIATPEHIESMGAILRERGKLKNEEVPFATKSGEKRLGLLTVDTIKIGEKPHFVIIMNDITETRQMEREMMNIVGDERRRIGQDLHDDLGQTLTGVAFLVQTLRQEAGCFSADAEQAAVKIGNLVRKAIMKVRTISKMLSPVEMESRGFITAVEEMVDNIQEVFLISCEVFYVGDVEVHDNNVASNLYYIAREAINNSIKHGNADEIRIVFEKKGNALVMSISDNGHGIPDDRPQGGIGLKTIEYRARIIGAVTRISGAEGGGTSVNITLPL
jgi:PAS domain S-box-containing protein